MIHIIVALILLVFGIIVFFTFFNYTSLVLNIVILVALYFLITRDLRESDNHKYYIAALLLTALVFVLSSLPALNYLIDVTGRYVSFVTMAALLVYVFAQVVGLVYEGYPHVKDYVMKNLK